MKPKTPIRTIMVNAIVARLNLISTANGFWTDPVLVSPENFDLAQNLTNNSIFVLEGEEKTAQGSEDLALKMNADTEALAITIQYRHDPVPADQSAAMRAKMISDIVKAIGTELMITDDNGSVQGVSMDRQGNVMSEQIDADDLWAEVYYLSVYSHALGDYGVLNLAEDDEQIGFIEMNLT